MKFSLSLSISFLLSSFPFDTFCFKVIEYYNDKNYLITEKSRKYSKLQDASFKYLNDWSIVNLNHYLNIFTDCLTHVINYQGLDFYKPEYLPPLVISRYDILHIAYYYKKYSDGFNDTYSNTSLDSLFGQLVGQTEYKRRSSHRIRLLPVERIPKMDQELKWCKRQWPDLECVEDIPYLDLSTKVRWTCEAQIYLMPPDPKLDFLFYDEDQYWGKTELYIPSAYKRFWANVIAFKNVTTDTDNTNMNADLNEITNASMKDNNPQTNMMYLVNSRSRYEILIHFGNRKTAESWKWALTKIHHVYGTTDMITTAGKELLIATIFPFPVLDGNNRGPMISQKILLPRPAVIFGTTALCRNCERCNPYKSILTGQLNSRLEIDDIFKFLNSKLENVLWRIIGSGDFVSIYQSNQGRFPNRPNSYREVVNLIQGHVKKGNLERLRWLMELLVLREIVGVNTSIVGWCSSTHDFDYSSNAKLGCDCGYHIYSYPVIKMFAIGSSGHAEIFMHKRDLRFVSCGRPDQSGWAFHRLTNIFDNYIWACTMLSVLLISGMSTMFYSLDRNYHVSNMSDSINLVVKHWLPSVLSYTKCLLDQGGPITGTYNTMRKLRVIFGTFLLISIVLSNAYKNENVTELTLPTLPVPFDRFDVIVQNRFQILTRAVYLSGQTESFVESLNPIQRFLFDTLLGTSFVKSNVSLNSHEISNIFRSELFSFIETESAYNDVFLLGLGSNRRAVNHSSKMLNLMAHTKLHPKWYQKLIMPGTLSNYDLIKRCNNTALMLPDSDAYQLYYQMRHVYAYAKNNPVFISKDPLLSHQYGLRFIHWVPQNIVRRAKAVFASGQIEWWDKLIVTYLPKILNASRVTVDSDVDINGKRTYKPSDMNGNIVVIFIVIGVGLAFTVIVFTIEVTGISKFKFSRVKELKPLSASSNAHLQSYHCLKSIFFREHIPPAKHLFIRD